MFAKTPVKKLAGQRRNRITLWEAGTERDPLLGRTPGTFTQFGADDAAVEEVPFIVNATEHGILYRVTLKYRADVVTKFTTDKKRIQVRGAGKTLNLLEIENPERRDNELVLHCNAVG